MKVRLKQEFRNEITLEVSPYRYWTFVPGHVYDIEDKVFAANRNFVEAVQEEVPVQPTPEFDRNVMFEVKEDEPTAEEKQEEDTSEMVFGEAQEQTAETAQVEEVQTTAETSEEAPAQPAKKIEPVYGKKRRK